MSCIRPQNMANVQDIQVFFVIPSHMKSLSETQWIHALRLLPPNSFYYFFLKKTHYFRTPYPLFSYICKISNYIYNYTLK